MSKHNLFNHLTLWRPAVFRDFQRKNV